MTCNCLQLLTAPRIPTIQTQDSCNRAGHISRPSVVLAPHVQPMRRRVPRQNDSYGSQLQPMAAHVPKLIVRRKGQQLACLCFAGKLQLATKDSH